MRRSVRLSVIAIMSGALAALTLVSACGSVTPGRGNSQSTWSTATVEPTPTFIAGTVTPAIPSTSVTPTAVDPATLIPAAPINFAISADFTPAGSGDTAPSILVANYELFIMGRVARFLPARWTTPDGARPADPRALLPDQVAIVTPVVIELDGAPLVNRAGADLATGQVVVAMYGGQVGDDTLASNLPYEQFTLGERVLVALTAQPLIWEPAGLLPTEAGPAWRVGMKWTLTDDGQAVSYWQTWRAADLIAALQAAGAPATPTPTPSTRATPDATPGEEPVPSACVTSPEPLPDLVYQGIALPQPAQPRTGDYPAVQLPPAWLLLDGDAVAASFGSFTYTYDRIAGCPSAFHADTAPPGMLTGLATARVPPDAELTIVVGAAGIGVGGATASAWAPGMPSTVGPDARALAVATAPEGDVTALRLPAPADGEDMLLVVSITFERGDVMYLWRLNPAG